MKENIDISAFDSVFKQQLENASSTPPAGVWEGISSSLAASASAATTAAVVKTALWIKIGIGVIATAAIATVAYIGTDNKNNTVSPKSEIVSNSITDNSISNEVKPAVEKTEDANIQLPAKTAKLNQKESLKLPDYHADIHQEVLPEQITPIKYTTPQAGEKTDAPKITDAPVQVDNTPKQPTLPFAPQSELPKKKVDSSFILVPNVFTPNGDGINDGYLIDIKGEEHVRIMIFDMNQKSIFETTDKRLAWNCMTPSGEPYPEGYYVVKVIYNFPQKDEQIKTVMLKLMR